MAKPESAEELLPERTKYMAGVQHESQRQREPSEVETSRPFIQRARQIANRKPRSSIGKRMMQKHAEVYKQLRRYIIYGEHLSDSVEAVIANDLYGIFRNADMKFEAALGDFVRYLYSYCPADAIGSKWAIEAWQMESGQAGRLLAEMQEEQAAIEELGEWAKQI